MKKKAMIQMGIKTRQTGQSLVKKLERARRRIDRAYTGSIKKETVRVHRDMKSEQKEGEPGGKRYTPLSKIRSYTRMGQVKSNTSPLAKLNRYIKYEISGTGDKIEGRIGFINVPTVWAKIARKHELGAYTTRVKESSRTKLRKIGVSLRRRGNPDAKYFFLKAGARMKRPKRPTLSPFWKANKSEIKRNIGRNFKDRMRSR